MELGVEGMMLSPGYSYDKAPDQQHFLGRARTRRLFRAILSNRSAAWKFNMSPLFLEFLMGKRHYACTPWGMPTYNLFGWQKPCYLLQRSEEHTSELQSLRHLVCRLLLEKKKKKKINEKGETQNTSTDTTYTEVETTTAQ